MVRSDLKSQTLNFYSTGVTGHLDIKLQIQPMQQAYWEIPEYIGVTVKKAVESMVQWAY